MHEIAYSIMLVGILVFSSHYFTHLFNKTRIPDAFFLIVIGLALGPIFGWIDPTEAFGRTDEIFTTIALIIILFEGGLELNFRQLSQSLKPAISLAGLNFIAIVAVVFLIYIFSEIISLGFFNFNLAAAILIGIMLANTSSAVVIPLLKQTKLSENSKSTIIVESAISDVLSIVIALAIFKAMEDANTQFGGVIGNLLSSFLVAVFIGFFGGMLWSNLLGKIRQIENSMFTTLAFVFLIYGLTEFLHFSGAIAALTFGITIGNAQSIRLPISKFNHHYVLHEQEKHFFSEIVFLVKTFFFIYLGLSVNFSDISAILFGLLLTAGILIIRVPVVKFSGLTDTTREDIRKFFVIIPKGLAAAVLATVPMQINFTRYEEYLQSVKEGALLPLNEWLQTEPAGVIQHAELIQNIAFVVIFFSIIATAILLFLVDKKPLQQLYDTMLSKLEKTKSEG